MNYVYDVILNFNKKYYSFYEWKNDDSILNFRKIPIFKVDKNVYLDLKYNDIIVDNSFITFINNCSYLIDDDMNLIAVLFSSGSEVLGISFDNDGKVIGRSSLILDEEEDILEGLDINSYNIKYKVINENKENYLVPRYILDKKEYLINFFNNNNNMDVYKYLYYDFFEREENSLKTIKQDFWEIINNEWDIKCDRLYDNVVNFNKVR